MLLSKYCNKFNSEKKNHCKTQEIGQSSQIKLTLPTSQVIKHSECHTISLCISYSLDVLVKLFQTLSNLELVLRLKKLNTLFH